MTNVTVTTHVSAVISEVVVLETRSGPGVVNEHVNETEITMKVKPADRRVSSTSRHDRTVRPSHAGQKVPKEH